MLRLADLGVEAVRINCAHDDPDVWAKMIEQVEKAAAKTGRRMKVLMDLAGPKMRTGEVRKTKGLKRIHVGQHLAIALPGRLPEIDDTLAAHHVDAIIAPTNSPSWTTDLVNGYAFLLGSSSPVAIAGYPDVSVPAGYSHGLPVGVTFIGGQWDEPELISLAYAWEHATHIRRAPQFLPSVP